VASCLNRISQSEYSSYTNALGEEAGLRRDVGATSATASTREPPAAPKVCSRLLRFSPRVEPARLLKSSRHAGRWAIRPRLARVATAFVMMFAQFSAWTVKGVVVDHRGRPTGDAVIQAEGLISLQIRSFVTENDGRYHFLDLNSDRDYKLQARYDGAWGSARTLSAFDHREEATVNIRVDTKKERSPPSRSSGVVSPGRADIDAIWGGLGAPWKDPT
jgi:hypothetical protein